MRFPPMIAPPVVGYFRLCGTEQLESTRGQEMAARCIVEMGTTNYY
jgi:hypothetical protein